MAVATVDSFDGGEGSRVSGGVGGKEGIATAGAMRGNKRGACLQYLMACQLTDFNRVLYLLGRERVEIMAGGWINNYDRRYTEIYAKITCSKIAHKEANFLARH